MTLHDEILEQPESLARLIGADPGPFEAVAGWIAAGEIEHVWIAARGTSDHAAIYAQYVLGVRHGLAVGLAAPSIVTLYGEAPRLSRALVIGISQSGASPDVGAVVAGARAQGARTLAITNDPSSALGTAAEVVVDLAAGPERAVAATKTYTAELVAIARLSAALSGDPVDAASISALPGSVAEALATEPEIERIATDQAGAGRGVDRCVVLGRGFEYATAREWALKLKELARAFADPYSAADFQHGPLALIEPAVPVLAVATSGAVVADLIDLLRRLRDDLDARLLVLSDLAEACALGTWAVPLPDDVAEWLRPVVSIVPAQLHAMHVTAAKGLDPDRPRAIRKVTRTR